ncbi:MAG: DoxX family protein [Pseudomonadota bacterium]|nr:DoxX family protein [Pseudomonadota bacterium]
MGKINIALSRILVSQLFIISGIFKITGYITTQTYMLHMGVPGFLLPFVILTEIGGGLALLLGYHERIAAFLLAGFSVIAALIFHHDFSNQMQLINFMKNLAIAGGLLFIVEYGGKKTRY